MKLTNTLPSSLCWSKYKIASIKNDNIFYYWCKNWDGDIMWSTFNDFNINSRNWKQNFDSSAI